MHRRVRPFFFLIKRCLLRASMLLWSAWANASAYTSYINGWKSWRNKKIGRTRTHWTLAKRQCQWRNKFGIVMSTSESLKGRVSYQNSAKAWEMLVSAWEREIASKCVRLTLNAWDFRALSLRSLLAAVFCTVLSKKVARDRQRHLPVWGQITTRSPSSFHVPAEMPDEPLVVRTLRC